MYFECFAVTFRAQSQGRPPRHVVSLWPEIFEYAEHVAEPDRCTEPPFALGTSALEFSNFDKSGLGGR